MVSLRRATVFSIGLDGGFPGVEVEGFTCHWVTDRSDPLVDLLDEPGVVRASLMRGDAVCVAMKGEEFASRLAVSLRSFREPFMGVRVHLEAGSEAWLGEMHTQPEFRRQGLSRLVGATAMDHLGRSGVRTVYLSAEDWNEASRGGTRQQGYEPVCEFRFVRILRRWGFLVPWSPIPRVRPLVRGSNGADTSRLRP